MRVNVHMGIGKDEVHKIDTYRMNKMNNYGSNDNI